MNKPHIIIIDDSPVNIQILMQALAREYRLTPFSSPLEAVDFLTKHPSCDIVLLDIDMPDANGYETFEHIRRIPELKNVPVIFVTARSDVESEISAFNLGIVDYIRKPIIPALAKKRIEFSIDNYLREKRIIEEAGTIKQLTEVTIKTLVSLVDRFDKRSDKHIERVMAYVTVIAEQMAKDSAYKDEMTPEFIANLRLSAPFHDCGKAYVSDVILGKAGKLTPDEYAEIQQRTVLGCEIMRRAREMMGRPSFYDLAEQMVLYCHERWDGSGYPQGLSGEDIPLCARIMGFADVYDTLIRERPYKGPLTHDEAVSIMIEGRGKAFDPEVCDAFEKVERTLIKISEEIQ